MSKGDIAAAASIIAAPFVGIAVLNAMLHLNEVTGGLSTLALWAGVTVWLATHPDLIGKAIHG